MLETVLGFFQGRMIGVAGVFVILAIAILFSKNPARHQLSRGRQRIRTASGDRCVRLAHAFWR